MPLTNDGAVAIASALLGDGSVPLFNNSNAALGVGDDTTSFSASQSELQAEANASNALRKGMDTGYPDREPDGGGDTNKTRYQSTFGTGEGNFDWEEWGVFNDSTASSGTMLNRVVESLGTKTSSASWVFQVDITIST